MGNDGGTIPTRIELVKRKKQPKKADKDAETAAKWKYCQISQEPLRPPIVACNLGRLYNKDSVIQHVLNKKTSGTVADHIKSMKDVRELNLTVAAAGSQRQPSELTHTADQGGFYQDALWVCPVTGLEMTGRQPFSFMTNCGCVISERALKALRSETCPSCNKECSGDQIIPLNPCPEDLEKLKRRLELQRIQKNTEKKAIKDGKKRLHDDNEQQPTSSKHIAIAEKVDTESKDSNLKHSLSRDADVQNLAKKSIANDPKASKVYKSLFTTSDNAKNQTHAHWVTHNPFYN